MYMYTSKMYTVIISVAYYNIRLFCMEESYNFTLLHGRVKFASVLGFCLETQRFNLAASLLLYVSLMPFGM